MFQETKFCCFRQIDVCYFGRLKCIFFGKLTVSFFGNWNVSRILPNICNGFFSVKTIESEREGKERVKISETDFKTLFFVTYNITISHIFPQKFIKLREIIWKIWRFSSSILTTWMNFHIFFHISLLWKPNNVSIRQLLSACFYFQPILYRLCNNCMKLYCYYIRSWNIKLRRRWGGSTQPHKGKDSTYACIVIWYMIIWIEIYKIDINKKLRCRKVISVRPNVK